MIEGCLRCGGRDLHMLTIRDGLAADGGETTGKKVCRTCDWQGIPVVFDDESAYLAFRRGLQDATEGIVERY